MHEIILGAAISGLMGFVIAVPALVVEASRRRGEHLPIVSDIHILWGWKLNAREVFVASLFLHLAIATIVGGLYVWFAERGWLVITNAPYALHSILIFTALTWAVLGLIVFPILGMGFFAVREGKHVWFEMLVTHVLIAFGFWLAVMYYRPFFF